MAAVMLLLGSCGGNSVQNAGTSSTSAQATATSVSVDTSEMFTDRDLEIGYDQETAVAITLSGDSAVCDSDAVEISGTTITICDEGTYILTGSLEDGMVIVNAQDADKVQLVLDNVQITSATSAAIYVLEADKVFLTTAADSDNALSNGGSYEAIDDNNIDAVLFSKADLTLNGAGTLTINAAAGHGVVSKDDLVVTSGTYQITAASHGLSGKDSVRIAGGTFTIVSGKDAVQAENDEDASLGFLYVAGGSFDLTAEGDGLSASSYLLVEEGTFQIQTGGGSANAVQDTQETFGPEAWQQAEDTQETQDTVSTKGLKAATNLTITGGSFVLDCADDGLHSNGDLTLAGGSFEIATGDDGLHADTTVTISQGELNITQSYEGIEGLSIYISGGTISLVASDDGLNAAGGTDSSGFGGRGGDTFGATEGALIEISGGTLSINASGDGIDSNGDLRVSGGETYVSGPESSGDGVLDYAGEAVISGGVFVAAGDSGMAQNFGTDSTQGVMLVTVESVAGGSDIVLTDSSGAELIRWQSPKAFNSVLISCPELVQGDSYTLTAGDSATEVTLDSLVYGSGGGMGLSPGGKGAMDGGLEGAPGDGSEPLQGFDGEEGVPSDFGGRGPGASGEAPDNLEQPPQDTGGSQA